MFVNGFEFLWILLYFDVCGWDWSLFSVFYLEFLYDKINGKFWFVG